MTRARPPSDPPASAELPMLARFLVRTLCAHEHVEELEGDLLELFARRAQTAGVGRARRASMVDALSLCLRRSRFTGARKPRGARSGAELSIYWRVIMVALGAVGVGAVLCGALSLFSPKLAALAIPVVAWFYPDPICLLFALLRARREHKRAASARA